ncbi:metalloenzyme domain protein [Ruminiclostridium papyrosolvens DSM 2782]|uniref:Metalloenzyme domain protein n=1 Tax=Ruminiclostridium papyrosolvens DSM 2782 TaxID=588581 RepID=F1TCY4_9FIRM|nr:peptidase [Ruminiclostridium papyrosolvens]EGD47851.1 metalloenzyme domain protein [Ruminiclostridium papyrosolvens DSM 2782]WES34565.1 peptidase [Ruminiclostridium papyrosolvens DSM 2782]
MKVIFIFLDGVGIGEKDRKANPVYATQKQVLARLIDNARFQADASMGVEGLPQSATGQTAIFTGVNAPKVLNRHLSGQPTISLKKVIYKSNIFSELVKMGYEVTSSNVYRDEYLENMLNVKDRKHRPSVTSVMSMAAGIEFRTVDEFINENGVYHDITGETLKESGYEVDTVTPKRAAQNLYRLSRNYDFILYEHFLTDIQGHKADFDEAVDLIDRLDNFFEELMKQMNFEEDVLIMTSDHGNIEDVSIHTHTMNKVPVVVLGKKAENIKTEVHSLTDIMPFVLEVFSKNG